MSLLMVIHPLYVTDRMPYFTGISSRVIILYGIKGIQRGQADFRGDVV